MVLIEKLAVRFVTKSTKIRHLSTAVQPAQVQEESSQSFRTKENNPVNHNIQHLNRFYTVPQNDVKVIYCHGLPSEYEKHIKTFAEMSLLIRKPAIELLTCLSQTDYTKPVNRYVLYGDHGCGKTTTLCHILNYGYKTNKILVNIDWAQKWFQFPKEMANSETKEGMVDLPIDAATWLLNFKTQNASLLAQANLKLSKTYEWNSEDSSMENSSLTEIIDFGINRVKYACDVITVLLDELKQSSIAGKCKILVVIDGFNAFFSNHTQIKNDMKELVPTSKVSLTKPFLDITKTDWCNGQVVVTVDQKATNERQESYLPRYLLSKEGFDHLDPFLPIAVENYTQDEFDTVIEYYKNRKWIRHITLEGQKELKLLTGSNPYKLMEYCKHL